jgi:outer membrane receptor protein involved in Fe transport
MRAVAPALLAAAIAVATPDCVAVAQTADGRVIGTVTDALGRPVAGAQLHLQAPDGRPIAAATANEDGTFSFSSVAPGTYAVLAEKADFETSTAIVTVATGAAASATIVLTATKPLDLALAAKQLELARQSIQPRIGASTYSLSQQAIQNQPGSDNVPLNQTLLQAPGVAQDSFGQIHVRNEHANIQYRINGVALPEGVSFFGQSLTSRFASSVDLITGAMPAQYGLLTAGVVDIQTKSGAFEPGGYLQMYGGSHDWLQPSAEYGGSVGHFNYYVAGDYLQNDIGIENPTPSYNPIHDSTQQGHGFAYLEDIVDPTSKVSVILGTFRGQFQIPNIPGQTPSFTVNGSSNFDSSQLNENQREINHYGIVSYLKSEQDFDVQISGFTRYSSVTFDPDPALGDLFFNGISQQAYRNSFASGVQVDGSYKLATDHTLRSGLQVTGERAVSKTTSTVEASAGPDTPFAIADDSSKTGWTYSIYLQDEWRMTPDFTLNFGGRFDVVNAFTNENQLSPRINGVWKATPTTTVHAGYANYFTPPPLELVSSTTISKFVGTTAQPEVLENAPVKAERAHYFDIGLDQEILPGLTAGIDAYYKYSRNLIDEGQFGAPIILTAFNYHEAQNHGVQFTGNYVAGNFSAYGNLALAEQRAEGITSAQFNFGADELAFIASHPINTDHSQSLTASGGVSYVWRGTRFSADMIAGSGLRSGFANISSLPAYEQVNLGISHRFEQAPGGPIEVRLDVINLLDQVYEIRSGTGVGVGAPQFGPRRAVFAGIKKEF